MHSSDFEGFGNVLVEALSFGLPICATDCPGSPAWLLKNGRFGKLVPLNSVESFSTAILDCASDPNPGLNSYRLKEYANQFNPSIIASRYLDHCLSFTNFPTTLSCR